MLHFVFLTRNLSQPGQKIQAAACCQNGHDLSLSSKSFRDRSLSSKSITTEMEESPMFSGLTITFPVGKSQIIVCLNPHD